MALATYADLKQSIINWSHRSDMDLLIDDFIALTESDMFKNTMAHEALELREMETTSTATINADALALPDGFLSMRSFRVTGSSGYDLLPKSADSLYHRGSTGRPKYYAITSQIEFDVSPDQNYDCEMVYFKQPTGLSSINTTNLVLTNHPEIYLYGALWALFTHADDEAQAQKYYQRYADAVNGANAADEEGRFGVAPYMRVQGVTP